MLTWKQQLITHMGGDWRWCYVVYKIGWNVVSRVSCKVAAVLSGSSEWCESGVVGGGATWQSRLYPPPSLQSTPPPPSTLPPSTSPLSLQPATAGQDKLQNLPTLYCTREIQPHGCDISKKGIFPFKSWWSRGKRKYLLNRLWIATSGKLVRPCLCPACTQPPTLSLLLRFRDPRQGLRMWGKQGEDIEKVRVLGGSGTGRRRGLWQRPVSVGSDAGYLKDAQRDKILI